MGATYEVEKTFEDFIGERGYLIAPVSIDTMDWMILSAYAAAQKKGDRKMMKRVSDEYLKFVDVRFDYTEKFAADLFGRPVDQILLLHINEMNADNFEALVEVIRKRGYEFVTLEQALKDPIYRFPKVYHPTSDILLNWSLSKKKSYDPPQPPEFIRKVFEQQSN